ncbi:MAG: hydratase [Spirochaetales bacterium]|nr:hydratase [Spirochaetales bacterium]
MIEIIMDCPVYLIRGMFIKSEREIASIDKINQELVQNNLPQLGSNKIDKEQAEKATMAYQILSSHNSGTESFFKLTFDALASHDITFVNIIQTAIACGLRNFPVPYVLTNCHNSLCAVGGTINEDDHMFGLTAAKRFGGIYVPPHMAVIHQYVREQICIPGNMILGSDSHTRYGALGVMGIGEGGPEIVKQLLKDTYDIQKPGIIAVYLEGKPGKGIGPQDIALAIIGSVFKGKYVKNKILEFVGPGIEQLSVDFRNGIDVMTTETTCLSSIWQTDEKVKAYYDIHGSGQIFKKIAPGEIACYDGMIKVNLGKIKSMVAVPFHPANVYTIADLQDNLSCIASEIDEYNRELIKGLNVPFSLKEKIQNGTLKFEQGVVAGCAGGIYENIVAVSRILDTGKKQVPDFSLYVYPASQPVHMGIIRAGVAEKIIRTGGIIRPAFCGPCFGACDVPSHQGLSIRHTTRNFPNREGSKPSENQISAVFLMDARSIAATAVNNGVLTSACDIDYAEDVPEYQFDEQIYNKRVYSGFGKPDPAVSLHFGPNIKPWPEKPEMPGHLLLVVASSLNDPVTTTDELIPSGETSSFRSDPEKLSTFFLSKRDPRFFHRILEVQEKESDRQEYIKGKGNLPDEITSVLEGLIGREMIKPEEKKSIIREMLIGGVIYANKPGDGSAREQAASCQKILDVWANIARDYATKRYRSNLINWGILPFILPEDFSSLETGEYVFIPHIRKAVHEKRESIDACRIRLNGGIQEIRLELPDMAEMERTILLAGNVINFYKKRLLEKIQ